RHGLVYATVTPVTPQPSEITGLYTYDQQGRLTKVSDLYVVNLALDRAGTVYATVFDIDPTGGGVTSTLVAVEGTGAAHTVAEFPAGSEPSGIDADGQYVYAAGLNNGTIYRVDTRTGAVEEWATDDRFLPADGELGYGLTGLQVHHGSVYVMAAARDEYWRVPITRDRVAGSPELVAADVAGDDFDIDVDGTAYVTTHPYNTLLRVTQDGAVSVVGDASTGIVGATSASFGIRNGRRALFVVGDGGYFVKNRLTPEQLEAYPSTTREDFSDPFLATVTVRPGR
ncbi:MAG: hypothetical protein ACRCZD_02380, partial [Phycicoccus sp.]